MKNFSKFLKEEKDDGEYGQQGGMAKSQLRMIMSAAKRLHDSLKDDDSLPGHIIANIVLATDYVTGSADYMESEMNDEGDEEEEDDYEDNYEMDDMDESKLAEKRAGIALKALNSLKKEEVELDENTGGLFKNASEWENSAKDRGLVVKSATHPSGEMTKYQIAKDKQGNNRGHFDHGTKSGRLKEEVKLDEVSTEKLRDYASAALQDKNKAKADKRWKYAAKAIDKVVGRDVKAAHALKYNKNEEVELDEGLYHVSYGAGLDHQVVANDAMDAHKKAMAHFKKTKPKLNDPKYADTFDKKSITRVKGDEPRSDKYKTEETTRERFRNYTTGGTK